VSFFTTLLKQGAAYVALCCGLSGAAYATQWKLITTSSDHTKITYWYVDPSSIVIESNLLQARLRTAWSTTQYGPNNTSYQSTTYLNFIDCERRTIAFTGNTYFSDRESTSAPVYQEDAQPVQTLRFSAVRPGTPGELRINYLCQSYGTSSNKVI
jgi:hypothetical protein